MSTPFRARLLLAAAVAFTGSAAHAAVSNLLVFGDSLSDVGNVATATFGLFPGPGYFAGRFSNGPIWIDSLAAGLGLPTTTPNVIGGNNYAVGGSCINQPNPFGPLSAPSFSTLLTGYLATNPTISPDTLITVWVGSNDFLLGPTDADTNTDLANTVAQGLAALRARGASQFLVLNVPPVGFTPGIRSAGADATAAVNASIQDFNARLAAGVAAFDALPDTAVTYLDTYALLQSAIATPAAFGFTNVTDAAFAGGTPSPDAATYLWWDSSHPTTAGHTLLATAALQAIPEPSAALLLLPALPLLSRRRR